MIEPAHARVRSGCGRKLIVPAREHIAGTAASADRLHHAHISQTLRARRQVWRELVTSIGELQDHEVAGREGPERFLADALKKAKEESIADRSAEQN